VAEDNGGSGGGGGSSGSSSGDGGGKTRYLRTGDLGFVYNKVGESMWW